ncbi:MAG: 4Fe-4S binding protein [Eggerthellaceae bacterium]
MPAAQRAARIRATGCWAALLSTAVFGFPVFCLICPVGLTFATLIAVWRLFQFNEVALSLLVFPAMLALEVLVLRKWCSRFCPLGALRRWRRG